MANVQQANFELKRLTRSMSSTIKKWKSSGGEPTVPDLAAAVQSWKNDMERLTVHDELNGPSFQMAQRKMMRAWDKRASRKEAIEVLDEAVTSLESVPGEMAAPDPIKSYHIKNRQELYGEDISRYSYDPPVFNDIYAIHRQISGFEMAPTADYIDAGNIQRVKAMLEDVTYRYDRGTQLNFLGTRAVKCLDMARMSTGRRADMKRYFSEAAKLVGQMGVEADLYHAPVAYKAQLGNSNAGSAIDAVERLTDLMYQRSFSEPSNFMRAALKSASDIVLRVGAYFDPKAARLAREVQEHLVIANENMRDTRVKSIRGNAWDYDGVSVPFNEAMNKLSALDAYIRTL